MLSEITKRNFKNVVEELVQRRAQYHIIIDGGNTFEGDEQHLADCFGVTVEEIEDWCFYNDMTVNIFELSKTYVNEYMADFEKLIKG